jgi:hypothetical protein
MSSSPFLNFIRNELRLRSYSLKTAWQQYL